MTKHTATIDFETRKKAAEILLQQLEETDLSSFSHNPRYCSTCFKELVNKVNNQ